MHPFKRTAILLALSCGLPAVVLGTTLTKMSTEQLIAESSDIVLGTVTNVRSVWVNRTLMTLATVSVSESLKGTPTGEVTVVIPGGIDTSRAVPVAIIYPGAPLMSPSDEVLLFLQQGAAVPNALQVVGYSQGKFAILRDATGITLAQGMTSETRLELADLKTQVRATAPVSGGDVK